MVDVLPLPDVRGEVQRGGTRYRGPTKRAQHDAGGARSGGAVQAGEAREGARPRDPRLFHLARPFFGEDLRPLCSD